MTPFSYTYTTLAARALRSWPTVGIEQIIRMFIRAMGFARIHSGKASTTQNVCPQRDRFKMSWSNAMANTAEMVNSQTCRDRTNKQFVGETMGQDKMATAVTKHPIAKPLSIASPEPTTIGFLNFRPEALFYWLRSLGMLIGHRKGSPFGVMPPEVTASRRLTSSGAL